MQLEIRVAEARDLASILTLFKDCVLTVCREDYSEEQLTAWVSASENIGRWTGKIDNQFFIVAIYKDTIVGFGSLEGSDTIDLLYVHKSFQRLGVAGELFNVLRTRAEQLGTKTLKAEVSKTARSFFESRGFTNVVHQSKQSNGVMLDNYQMIKALY
jgi:putative acetyltransferase